ncbi:MAG: LCP family protein, partial [Peptococcaceae bacterium]|nr:LCP family protein [Peptococcaceae bacterium]
MTDWRDPNGQDDEKIQNGRIMPLRKETQIKKFDAWEDLRDEKEDQLAEALSVSLPGVIDIPQTGTLFEVLSEIPDKSLAMPRVIPRQQAPSGSRGRRAARKAERESKMPSLWPLWQGSMENTQPWAKAEEIEKIVRAEKPRYAAQSGGRDEVVLRAKVDAMFSDAPADAGSDAAADTAEVRAEASAANADAAARSDADATAVRVDTSAANAVAESDETVDTRSAATRGYEADEPSFALSGRRPSREAEADTSEVQADASAVNADTAAVRAEAGVADASTAASMDVAVAKADSSAEAAVLSGVISLADAVTAALAEAKAAAKGLHELEISDDEVLEAKSSVAAVDTAQLKASVEPVSEAETETETVDDIESASKPLPEADTDTPQSDDEYENPFFELPPLQRSRRKAKKAKRGRNRGLNDDNGNQEDVTFAFEEEAESAGKPELWKILLAVLICMLFAMGSYLVGKVYAASLIPDEQPVFILPIVDGEDENNDSENLGEAPKSPQILSMLFMGTDERFVNEQARADTIILALINLDTKEINVISIPRDTRTLIADSTNTTKINHAHTIGGAELMVKTVENLLGINVHYYVETNFKGFEKCIDILGGVEYNVER